MHVHDVAEAPPLGGTLGGHGAGGSGSPKKEKIVSICFQNIQEEGDEVPEESLKDVRVAFLDLVVEADFLQRRDRDSGEKGGLFCVCNRCT